MGEILLWTTESEEGGIYRNAAYYRCPGIEEFLRKVLKKYKVVGIVAEGNNIGFIIEGKSKEADKTQEVKNE